MIFDGLLVLNLFNMLLFMNYNRKIFKFDERATLAHEISTQKLLLPVNKMVMQ